LEHAHQVEYEQAEGRQIEQLDQQLLNQFVPNVAKKMPVVRAPMNQQDKGKGIQIKYEQVYCQLGQKNLQLQILGPIWIALLPRYQCYLLSWKRGC
jgi:hypothetical protein